MKYNLFISYSTDPDYKLSKKLELFLESFSKLASKYDKKLERLEVFRDGSDFKVTAKKRADNSINSLLVDNLKESEWLIVMCSENAAKSHFVNHEIGWFIENRGKERVLAAFTEGEEPGKHPEKYFSQLMMDHGIHKSICYDLRGFKKKADEWNKVRDLGEEMTKLAAHLYQTSINDIMPLWKMAERREKIQRRINLIVRTSLAILTVMLAILLFQRHTINQKSALNEKKSAISSLANTAFKIRETDRKVAHDSLLRTLNFIDANDQKGLEKERDIVQNLLNELRINLTNQPFYSHTLKTDKRGVVKKVGTRRIGNISSFAVLYQQDNVVDRYDIDTDETDHRQTAQLQYRHPDGAVIETFLMLPGGHLMIYDNLDKLILLDKESRMITSLALPGVQDMTADDFQGTRLDSGHIYVATDQAWYELELTPDSQLTLVRQVDHRFTTIDHFKVYEDGASTFLHDNRIYLTSDDFEDTDSILLIPPPAINSGDVNNYRFKSNTLSQRDLLVVSLGRIVEVYRPFTRTAYYKVNTIDVHQSTIKSIDFSTSGDIMIGSADKTVSIWKNSILYKKLVGHTSGIMAASFLDEAIALTSDESNTVRIWDLSDVAIETHELGFYGDIRWMKNLGQNKVGILYGDDHILLNFEDDYTFLSPLIDHADTTDFDKAYVKPDMSGLLDSSQLKNTRYSHFGDFVITGDSEGNIMYYQLPSTTPVASWKGHELGINDITFLKNNAYVLSGGQDKVVKVWKRDGNQFRLLHTIADHLDDIVDIDTRGRRFITASDDRSALLYELTEDDRLVRKISMIKHNTFIRDAAFLNDSLVVTGDDEGMLKVWNTKRFERLDR